MKEKINELLKEAMVRRLVKIFIASIFLYFLILSWKWQQLPPQLPLFYSLPKSNEQLATPFQLLLLPFFSILFFTINLAAAASIYPKEKLGSILLVVAGFAVNILLLYTFIKTVFLVS